MGYWWVNHSQTFKQEITGGYIWSPKMDKNGARNQAYINLTLIKMNDTVFSYAGGRIRAIGRVVDECQDRLRPTEFGEIGEQWERDGWLVKVDWDFLDKPISPSLHMSKIGSLLPEKYSPIRLDGKGNQKIYLAEIGDNLAAVLLDLICSENIRFRR